MQHNSRMIFASQCCSRNPADTTDAYVSQLNDVLAELLDKAAPVQTGRRRPQKLISKWLSADAVDAKRARRRLERRWRTTSAEADRSEYLVYRLM